MSNDNKKTPECQSDTSPTFCTYVIWCSVTGKYYVGVTRQKYVYTRIRQHKKGKKQFVDTELKKIGWQQCDWFIVEENIPANLISEREQYWVAFFNSVYPNGYNKTLGGIGNIVVSDDTRAKLSEIALERDMSGENNPMYGKHHTDEVKTAQSERMKGENNPNYGKPPANKGKKASPETRAKLSELRKGENNSFYGKHHTEESNEKNRQAHLGKKASDETRAKMSESQNARYANPAVHEQLSESRTGEKNHFYGKHHSDETKAKLSEANKGKPAWNKGKHPNAETRAKMSASARARCARQKAEREAAALAAAENANADAANQDKTS